MSSPSVASVSSGLCSIDDCNLFRHFLEGQVAAREHISQDLRFSQFFLFQLFYMFVKNFDIGGREKAKLKKHDVMKELHTPLSPDGKKFLCLNTNVGADTV